MLILRRSGNKNTVFSLDIDIFTEKLFQCGKKDKVGIENIRRIALISIFTKF